MPGNFFFFFLWGVVAVLYKRVERTSWCGRECFPLKYEKATAMAEGKILHG